MLHLDLNWLLQIIATAFIIFLGLLYLVKNTASKYFTVDATFDADKKMMVKNCCAVCNAFAKKHCAGCKKVHYCSEACQKLHWKSEHKNKCKDLKLSGKIMLSPTVLRGRRTFTSDRNNILNQSKKILFPYEKFVELFNWETPGFPPCGLLNCGNSCFANVVLQCLAYTRPLVAYLLEEGHRKECRRNGWCFLCEFQMHIERASHSKQPFSPVNILSRLNNIGGNFGYGKQEDAHEFMRFAIDTMQSVCLDEFGGEKAVHPSSQETTLIQHIFGGHLQSQVVCTKCNNVSNQFENMMDLTVEIQGDASSLEECLDQFTVREQLHGDNLYKCDGCNDYVLAWKRLSIFRAPNILTIALKRFQSGRFGKLNKRVTFPEILDLSPYMSETGDGSDVYKLYGVVVHVDMLNASYFGHYICYTKDYCGNWYRIDDCKVSRVDLDEVLSQGAYMLLYSRVRARPLCLNAIETPKNEESNSVGIPQTEISCTSEDSNKDIDTVSSEAMDIEILSNGNVHATKIDEESVLYPIETSNNEESDSVEVVNCTEQAFATPSVLDSVDIASSCTLNSEESSFVLMDIEIHNNGNGHSTEIDEESVLSPIETSKDEESDSVEVPQTVDSCTNQPVATSVLDSVDTAFNCGSVSDEDIATVNSEASSYVSKDTEIVSNGNGHSTEVDEESVLSPIENGKNSAKPCLPMDSLCNGSAQAQNHVKDIEIHSNGNGHSTEVDEECVLSPIENGKNSAEPRFSVDSLINGFPQAQNRVYEKAECGDNNATLISEEVLEEHNSAESSIAEKSGQKISSVEVFMSSNGFSKTGLFIQDVDEKRDYENSSESYSPFKSNEDNNKVVSRDSISFSNGVLDDVASVVIQQDSNVDEE